MFVNVHSPLPHSYHSFVFYMVIKWLSSAHTLLRQFSRASEQNSADSANDLLTISKIIMSMELNVPAYTRGRGGFSVIFEILTLQRYKLAHVWYMRYVLKKNQKRKNWEYFDGAMTPLWHQKLLSFAIE